MAVEEVTAAMDNDINDGGAPGGGGGGAHQDWPYREIVAIAGKPHINTQIQQSFD